MPRHIVQYFAAAAALCVGINWLFPNEAIGTTDSALQPQHRTISCYHTADRPFEFSLNDGEAEELVIEPDRIGKIHLVMQRQKGSVSGDTDIDRALDPRLQGPLHMTLIEHDRENRTLITNDIRINSNHKRRQSLTTDSADTYYSLELIWKGQEEGIIPGSTTYVNIWLDCTEAKRPSGNGAASGASAGADAGTNPNPGGAPAQFVELTGTVDTNGFNLRVRSGAGSTYSVLRTISDNAGVRIKGRDDNTEWLLLRFATGDGWVKREFIRVNGNPRTLPRLVPTDSVVDSTYSDSELEPIDTEPAPVEPSVPVEPPAPAPVTPDDPPVPPAPESQQPPPVSSACTDSAEFVTQSDYPTMPLGAEFSIFFTVRNTGTCTWTPGSGYSLTNSDGPTFGAPSRIDLQVTIPPGNSVQFDIPMSLPNTRDELPTWQAVAENRYRTGWFMNRNGANYGPWMYIDITVATPANQPAQPVAPETAPGQPEYPSVVLSGGMNLGGYCQDKGYAGVVLNENTAYGWKCVAADGSLSGIDVYELCRMQFGDGYAPTFSSEADPYSWRCELQNTSGSSSNPVADLINAGKWLDFNWDGNVNIDDYAGFQEMYASCQQQPTDVCRSLDYNGDGAVNINDFDIFAGIIRG